LNCQSTFNSKSLPLLKSPPNGTRSCGLSSSTISLEKRVCQHLGARTAPPSNLTWALDHEHLQVYVPTAGDKVCVHDGEDGRLTPPPPTTSTQSKNFSVTHSSSLISKMPKWSVPASVQFGLCLLTNHHFLEIKTPQSTPSSTFKQWLHPSLPRKEYYRLVHFFFSELAPKRFQTITGILQNPKGTLPGMQVHAGYFAWLLLVSNYWSLFLCTTCPLTAGSTTVKAHYTMN
jgi:hypothetical protein